VSGSGGEVACIHLLLETTACQPAEVRGTNGMSPPLPAGIRLRGKVSTVFFNLRRCPGRSKQKELGIGGIIMPYRGQCKQMPGTL